MRRGYTSFGSLHLKTILRSWCPLFLLLLMLPGRGGAQSPRERFLDFLDAASGFHLLGQIMTGILPAGETMSVRVNLVEGADYMVAGYCDSDCTNLDLVLVDSFGEEVEADTLPDAEPVLMFRAEATGAFFVRAEVMECPSNACTLAFGVMGSTAEPGMIPGEDMAGRLTLVGAEFMSLGFLEIGDERVGSLNNEQTVSIPITLEAGREYRMVAVCDQDCFDLDLALLDPEGETLTSDVLDDAIPILAHIADSTAEHSVEVRMIACGLEPCAFRLASFAKNEIMGPWGVSFTGELISHDTHRGELGPEDQLENDSYLEIFQVEAKAGQRIIVDLRSDHFDTRLRLQGPGGVDDANDDYGFDTGHSHIERLVEADGVYFVHVTSFEAGSTGSFVLQIAVVG